MRYISHVCGKQPIENGRKKKTWNATGAGICDTGYVSLPCDEPCDVLPGLTKLSTKAEKPLVLLITLLLMRKCFGSDKMAITAASMQRSPFSTGMQELLVSVTAKFPFETTASFYSEYAQFLNCRLEISAIKLPYNVNLFCSEEGLFRPVVQLVWHEDEAY